MYRYNSGPIMVRSEFEVIEGEEDAKISMEDSLQEHDKIEMNKSKFLTDSRNNKFPNDFRSAYPPSVTYLLWLKNNKRFPKWVYDMVRSRYHDENLEWRINELNKLYKKCDAITGGFPLSGIYIRHLLELINLQKRIDDRSIIQDINTKEDLDYLKSVHLPKANNSAIKLRLRDEDEILKKVDPIGYLKALAVKCPLVRNILYRKYLSISQEDSSICGDEVLKSTMKQTKSRLQRRNTTKRRIQKLINESESAVRPIIKVNGYKSINKIQNIIDLIEDPGLNISKSLRRELRQVCKNYLNNYLQETYNLTNILKRYLEEKQLIDDGKYKKLPDLDLDDTIETIGIKSIENKNKEIDIFFPDENDKNKKKWKQANTMSKQTIINKSTNSIKIKITTPGDTMYNNIKFKSNAEEEKKTRNKFNKLSEFIENTKIYKKIKKEFSDNYLLSKYDLIDVLENVGFDLTKKSKQDLTYLYGELLKNKQRSRLMEVFNEQTVSLSFPDMNHEAIIDMLTSLMLCNINNRRYNNRPKLANVLENLGFNMTKNAKKKINKLYFAKIKSNSNSNKRPEVIFT